MADERLSKSRKLSRLNLNVENSEPKYISYWCRVAFNKYDNWNMKKHSHSFFELQLCIKGECEFDVSGVKYVITPGTYILLPPDKKHTIIKASGDFEKFIWGFRLMDENLASTLSKGCLEEAPSKADENILRAIEIIMDNADRDSFQAYGIIKGQLHYILCMLIRKNVDVSDSEQTIKSTSFAAEEIMSFIKSNLSTPMSVSDIAAQFFMSARQITRICEKEFGMTLKELETSLKLEKIRNLLSEDENSLDEIAIRCGFSDGYSMSKFFKKHEGLPPGKYRKSLYE